MQRIVHDHPRSLRHQNSSTPEWLEYFVFRLLAKAPEARFQNASEVASILRQELAHLQNPTRIATPSRPWFAPEATADHPAFPAAASKSIRRWVAASLAIASIIIVSTLVLYPDAITTRSDDPTLPKSKSDTQVTSQAPSSHDQPPFDPTVLWESDGFAQLQTRIQRLGESVPEQSSQSPDALESRHSHLKSRLHSFLSEPF